MKKVLIANRGEIAVRIARTLADLSIGSVAVFSTDDALSLHTRMADEPVGLGAEGVGAYLDIERLIAIAGETGCDAVHPGYGFLSENAEFAERCKAAGLIFIGPAPEVLSLFGDKIAARNLAIACDVPVAGGTVGATSLEDVRRFLDGLGAGGAVMIKAVAGGGGRGMRVVRHAEEIAEAYQRCQSEARTSFGRSDVYVERLIEGARHVEVQIVGDGTGACMHLWERDCTLQRRHQKLIEAAPAAGLSEPQRDALRAASLRMARKVQYGGIGTFEFLVNSATGDFVFIETNPRLQVEHTITEAITGLDLVKLQIQVASGRTLADLGLDHAPPPANGYAVQLRINMERMMPDGASVPTGGRLTSFDIPSGPGLRTDTFGYVGYEPSGNFDSLLAKVIVHSPASLADALRRAYRALASFRIAEVETNAGFLLNLLQDPTVLEDRIDTRFVDRAAERLVKPGQHRSLFFSERASTGPAAVESEASRSSPEGTEPVVSPMRGRLVAIEVADGDTVRKGQAIAVIEAMKTETVIPSPVSGTIVVINALEIGQQLRENESIVFVRPGAADGAAVDDHAALLDPDYIRADLAEVLARRHGLLDAARPEAVQRRRKTMQRTARENIDDLCDPDTFVEYGGLTLAMQRSRRTPEELARMSPADGVITGLGSVNGALFSEERSRSMVMAYDYTVFAGTQGFMGHRKTDRAIEIAEKLKTPFFLFSEGGGGRPGDTDYVGVSALEFTTFAHFGHLSGKVPLIGINSGRCFAGNAALLGCCDIVIATRNSSIGMAGPAMIEGGGLGAVSADDVGPVRVQAPNGVVDIVVENERDGVHTAKRYLSYAQGRTNGWHCADQRMLRHAVPENRLRTYDIRKIIAMLADEDSVLELRKDFGPGIVTTLARIEGRPLGIIANNPVHLGGAIDADGADKLARFLQLCDAYALPVVSLCDTPGFMVGPESEKTATVRHFARVFVTSANLKVPVLAVILRKAYGLGAQAMLGGNLHAPLCTVAWPTGELGPMGLEGAVRLAFRKELEAIEDVALRDKEFKSRVDELYAHGKALNAAGYAEIDDVIDPAATRTWILRMLRQLAPIQPGRTMIDPW